MGSTSSSQINDLSIFCGKKIDKISIETTGYDEEDFNMSYLEFNIDGKKYYALPYTPWIGIYGKFEPITKNEKNIKIYDIHDIKIAYMDYRTTYSGLCNYLGIYIVDFDNNNYTITCGYLYDKSPTAMKMCRNDY